MAVNAAAVREFLSRHGGENGVKQADVLAALEGRVTDAEAIRFYRKDRGLTEDTDEDRHPLDEKIRLGRRGALRSVLGNLVGKGEVLREGRGGKARVRLNPDFKPKNISKIGVGRPQVRAFLLQQPVPCTLQAVIDYFLPLCDRAGLLEMARAEVTTRVNKRGGGSGKQPHRTDDELVQFIAEHIFNDWVRDICRELGWSYTRPPVTQSIIVPGKVKKHG